MSQHKQYDSPPITEAIINVLVETSLPVDPQVFGSLGGDQYAEKTEVTAASVSVHLDEQSSEIQEVSHHEQHSGYAFRTLDKRQVFQARAGQFVFSWLEPYCGWNRFSEEARRLWGTYQKLLSSHVIKQIGVRYINRLNLPQKDFSLGRYLRTMPDLSADLPTASLSGYILRLQLPLPDLQAEAIVNQALLPPVGEDIASILLDIDVIRSAGLPDNDNELWKLIEDLHHCENRVFESSITNATRETFK